MAKCPKTLAGPQQFVLAGKLLLTATIVETRPGNKLAAFLAPAAEKVAPTAKTALKEKFDPVERERVGRRRRSIVGFIPGSQAQNRKHGGCRPAARSGDAYVLSRDQYRCAGAVLELRSIALHVLSWGAVYPKRGVGRLPTSASCWVACNAQS